MDKNLPKHVNGKPQNVKNVTWGANMVQEFHAEYNGSPLQDDVDMRAEDAGDAIDERKDTPPYRKKKMAQKCKEMVMSCEKEYVPKVKLMETVSETSTSQNSGSLGALLKTTLKNGPIKNHTVKNRYFKIFI